MTTIQFLSFFLFLIRMITTMITRNDTMKMKTTAPIVTPTIIPISLTQESVNKFQSKFYNDVKKIMIKIDHVYI